MADTSRMSGFLPTIKCSMCAQEIEISMMGEHVCGPAERKTSHSTIALCDASDAKALEKGEGQRLTIP